MDGVLWNVTDDAGFADCISMFDGVRRLIIRAATNASSTLGDKALSLLI